MVVQHIITSALCALLGLSVAPHPYQAPPTQTVAMHTVAIRKPAPPMEIVPATLRIRGDAGRIAWPNDGVMPLLSYGWGGDRPIPARYAVDSTLTPLQKPDSPPILIVQRRTDLFSPLLQEVLDQNAVIPSVTLTVDPDDANPASYTMYDVRIIGIRDVGRVFQENPSTEEVVLIFSTMRLGDR